MTKTTAKFTFDNSNFEVDIIHGHVWLVVGQGISTPLAMQHDPEGGRYAYVTAGTGTNFKEVRIYEDGSVVM